MKRLETIFCGKLFSNPTVVPAGFLGVSLSSLKRAVEHGAGGVTTKSIGPKKKDGWSSPIVATYKAGLLNAVGLPSPGYEKYLEEFRRGIKLGAPLIGSVYGGTAEEYVTVSTAVEQHVDFLELNISCPNTRGKVFGKDPLETSRLVSKVKEKTKKPVIVKLSPNTDKLLEVAKAAEDAGADALAAVNTFGPGMLIDVNTAKPVLSFKTGGVSGPGIMPLALKCVYDVSEKTSLPVLGVGGVSSGEDAAQFIMAGASLVGIGTAMLYRGLGVFSDVCGELEKLMEELGYSKIEEMRGAALR